MINNDSLSLEFQKVFQAEPTLIARAPGRINLIGEHTDYNGGFVLPAAIDYEIKMAARVAAGSQTRLWSVNYGEAFEFDPAAPLPVPAKTQWFSYFLGVMEQFRKRGCVVPALEICIYGDVPLGAGLSSSAAFEVCAATLMNFVCDSGLSGKEVALMAQAAEHSPFVGVRCGIMDQFASALGAPAAALLLDCFTLDFEVVPFDAAAASIVIINSNKPRELRSSEYNQRRLECEQGLRMLNQLAGEQYESLRHVPAEVFLKYEARLPELVARRVRHNVTENGRVLAFVEALRGGNWKGAGELLYFSHQSLRDDFEVSCTELDAIVEIARSTGLAYGCRMTGGGFGGCAVALVHPDNVQDFTAQLAPAYEGRTGLSATIYVTSAAAGAGMVLGEKCTAPGAEAV
jgi:galactokinase